jgi:hypothetical protein
MKFRIDIYVCDSFTIEEIWPEKDAPENPTVEDVKAVFFKKGFSDSAVHRTCEDWGLCISRHDVTITADSGDELLRRLEEAKRGPETDGGAR